MGLLKVTTANGRSTYFVRVNGTLAEVDDAAWVSFTWPGRKKGEKLLIDNKKKVFFVASFVFQM